MNTLISCEFRGGVVVMRLDQLFTQLYYMWEKMCNSIICLIASKCESLYEICTQRYCYFCISFSKDYVALRYLSLNKQSQLANNLQV